MFEHLLIGHLLVSILHGGLALVAVLCLFKVLRIRDPAARQVLLLIPLVKAAIVFLWGATLGSPYAVHLPLGLSITLPTSSTWIGSWRDTVPSALPTLAWTLGALTIGLAAVLLTLQFLSYMGFHLWCERTGGAETPVELEHLVATLAERAGTATPRVVMCSGRWSSPFTVGFLRPKICIPRILFEELPWRELKAVLAHEVGHVARRDNLAQWLALGLRDLLFFNPVAHLCARLFARERERAADSIAARLTGDPTSLAAALLLVAGAGAGSDMGPRFPRLRFAEADLRQRVTALLRTEDRSTRIWPALGLLAGFLIVEVALMIANPVLSLPGMR